MPRKLVMGGAVVTDVPTAIALYAPKKVTAPTWTLIAPFVRACVTDSRPASPWAAGERMTTVTRFCDWALEEFLPLDREVLFTPDMVERYALTGMGNLQESSRRTHRSQLTTIGRAITRRAPWPPPKISLGRNRLATPYTPGQVAGYLQAAGQQSTPLRTRAAFGLLAGGLGAGLMPGEHLTITGRSITLTDDGATVLTVSGTKPRTIPVLAAYAHARRTAPRRTADRPEQRRHQEPPQQPPVAHRNPPPASSADRILPAHHLADHPLHRPRAPAGTPRRRRTGQHWHIDRPPPAPATPARDRRAPHHHPGPHRAAEGGRVSEAARTLLPLHLTKLARRPSREQALRRAHLMVDRSGLFPAVEAVLHHQVGKPREFTAKALLTGLAVHALLLEEMHLTRVLDTLADLSHTARGKLGLTTPASYRMLWYAYTRLIHALDTGTLTTPHNHPNHQAGSPGSEERVAPCPDDCPYQPISLSEFVGRLLDASLPEGLPLTGAIAIDSTDYETWARRRAWTPQPDIAPDHAPVPVEDTPPPSSRRPPNEPGWPCTGAEGRLMHTVDSDAREGYRSGTNASPGNVFCGFDLHLAVNARALGPRTPEVPFVITAMHLAVGGSHKGNAGVTLIDQHLACHPHTSEVIADRGYSFCTPAQWAHPVRARGLQPVIDLHPKQRGTHPGPLAATVIIDGTLFTDALPHPLRDLPGFPIGMRTAEKAKLRARYDQRAAYAFTPHSRPDTDGYQRFKGPALAGHLRCPNHPASMRLPHTRPTSTCPPGAECACGRTVTLSPDVMA